jgi:hypothetical protein
MERRDKAVEAWGVASFELSILCLFLSLSLSLSCIKRVAWVGWLGGVMI